MPPGPGNGGGGPAAAANAAAMAAGAASAAGTLPGGASNNASLRLPQMPNTNPLLTAAAKAAAASGGINLPLPWPQNMRPKEAMPISPPLTPLPATMRYVLYFFSFIQKNFTFCNYFLHDFTGLFPISQTCLKFHLEKKESRK